MGTMSVSGQVNPEPCWLKSLWRTNLHSGLSQDGITVSSSRFRQVPFGVVFGASDMWNNGERID